MRKYLPLVLVLLLFTGCSLFNSLDKIAVEKAISELKTPMSSQDAELFPDLTEITSGPNTRDLQFEGNLNIGEWQKEIKAVKIDNLTATAVCKWTYPITVSFTIDGQTTHLDLSLFGEGTYTLVKNDDGTWKVTGFPLFTWRNKYGPSVSNVTIKSGYPGTISAKIPIANDRNSLVLGLTNHSFLFNVLVAEPSNSSVYSSPIHSFLPIEANTEHHGVITALTAPKTKDSYEYGITIAYFTTTTL